MKRTFLFRVLLSLILLCPPAFAKDTYVSLAPSVTEILYALGLEDGLLGVSAQCNYPLEVKKKENLGSLYGMNKERVLKLHPDWLFALDTSKPFLSDIEKQLRVKYFTFNSVGDILRAIEELGELLGAKKRAEALVRDIKGVKPHGAGKKVLYVVQSQPFITIGKNSYLTDAIRLSGNTSATKDVEGYYPSVSLEYVIRLNPDFVVVGPYADIAQLGTLFRGKSAKFVTLNKEQNDIINRPGARIGEAIQFFGTLK